MAKKKTTGGSMLEELAQFNDEYVAETGNSRWYPPSSPDGITYDCNFSGYEMAKRKTKKGEVWIATAKFTILDGEFDGKSFEISASPEWNMGIFKDLHSKLNGGEPLDTIALAVQAAQDAAEEGLDYHIIAKDSKDMTYGPNLYVRDIIEYED